MNIKRFFGKNSRQALNKVRMALGEDAIIISNRAVEGGNEIMAVSEAEIHAATEPDKAQLSHQVPEAPMMPPSMAAPVQAIQDEAPTDFDNAPTLLSVLQGNQPQIESPSLDGLDMDAVPETAQATTLDVTDRGAKHPSQPQQDDLSETIQYLLAEMRDMRNQVNAQFTAMHWNNQLQSDPVKSKVISALLSAKYSAALSRKITDKLPPKLDQTGALAWTKNVLSNNLQVVEDEETLFNQGGVYAIVGPTGVGKTTTTAKIAARYVMKYGTESLGLITTDGYRVGGHEQLRIYGKILGVMVHAVKDEDDLKIALNELKNKRMILIDTVGISQRDQMVTEQIDMLSKTGMPIQKLLCLNATCTGETLSDVIKTYKGRAMDGCIITKLDEAASSGSVLDVVIREKIKLYYTTHGQRVPEDIGIADKQALVSQSLALDSNSWAYQYLDEELPFVIADQAAANMASQERNHA